MRFISWLSGWAATLHIMIFERDLYRQLREPAGNLEDFGEVPPPGTDQYSWVGRDKDGNLVSVSAQMTLDGSVSLVKGIMEAGWTSFSMWRQDGSENVLVARMTADPPEFTPEEEDDPYFTDEEET